LADFSGGDLRACACRRAISFTQQLLRQARRLSLRRARDGDRPHWLLAAEHPVQVRVRILLEACTAAVLPPDRCAIDGCSVPTWAVPLENLARAFAKFGTGHTLGAERAAAAAGLRDACARKPWHVAGTGRFCTEIMQLLGKKIFVKTGAEGVCCASLPQQGFGVAIKCDDGADRAAAVIMAAITARFLALEVAEQAALARFLHPVLRNRNGIGVGALQLTDALSML
jgi:L-asparaginase II